MNEYFAHDASGQTQALQSADEHCRNTAKFAADALEAVRLRQSAYLAGLIHDLGKFTALFQEYLLQHSFKRGMVNHTFAGVRFLLRATITRMLTIFPTWPVSFSHWLRGHIIGSLTAWMKTGKTALRTGLPKRASDMRRLWKTFSAFALIAKS